jgi:hypothetical protein
MREVVVEASYFLVNGESKQVSVHALSQLVSHVNHFHFNSH